MRTVHAVIGGLALAGAMTFPMRARANMLTNGDFESLSAPVGPAGFTTLSAGSSDLPGWTVTGNSIDVVPNTYWQASSGVNSVDLDGTPGPGGITQSVATTPGVTYQLTFDFSVNPEAGLPGELALERIMDLKITAGDASVLHDEQFSAFVGSTTKSNMNYTGETVLFTATDSTSTLAFTAIGETTYTGPVIDNLILDVAPGSVPPGAPEPATLSVMGLASVGLLIRRRR